MRVTLLALLTMSWAVTGPVHASDLISLSVLPCGKVGAAGGLAAGPHLARVVIDTARYPKALCNDGSPGVFYFRPATATEDRNKWHISLQGGGSCGTGQTCGERWCSIGTAFGMDKMTSTLTKPSINGGGILSPETENHFATWNQILMFYCSSDGWGGRGERVEATATSGARTVNYAIHFHGADIVDAVIDILRSPANRARGIRRGSAPAGLPDLDRATQILFSGSSGGGAGIRTNGDRIAAFLKSQNVNCTSSNCPLDIRLLIDSAFPPATENLDYSRTTYCAEDPRGCTYQSFAQAQYELIDLAFWKANQDQSCLSYHTTVSPGTQWRCTDLTHVIQNHVTTPMFIGFDLQDELFASSFVDAGLGSLGDFGRAEETQLLALATLETTAEERSTTTGVALKKPGTFGPKCRGHENIGSRRDFFDTKVEVAGIRYSYSDVVWNWWSGAVPQNVVRPFDQPGAAPDCP